MEVLDLHPQIGAVRYTLRGLYRHEEDAIRKAGALAGFQFEVLRQGLTSPKGNQLFVVLAKHDIEPTRRTGIPRRHTTDWEATRMAVEAFRRTLQAAARAGTRVRWYKGLDIDALHRCVMSYNWRATYLDVSADILSSTITTHPFPNANHRTATSLTRLFLGSIGVTWPHYELRGRGIKRFIAASTPFIISSKYVLQVLRHRRMMRLAVDEGFTHLLVGGKRVEIKPSDLLEKDPALHRRHLALARRFVDGLADDEGRRALRRPCLTGLRDWVTWYER